MRPVTDAAGIEPALLKVRQTLLQLKDTPDYPSEGMIIGLVRVLFQSNAKVSPIIASFDLVPHGSSDMLLSSIERLCGELRATAAFAKPGGKGLGATDGGKGGNDPKKGDKGGGKAGRTRRAKARARRATTRGPRATMASRRSSAITAAAQATTRSIASGTLLLRVSRGSRCRHHQGSRVRW